jgi:hypothetical protein
VRLLGIRGCLWKIDYRWAVGTRWRVRNRAVPFDGNTHTAMFFPVPLVLGIETRVPIFHLSLIWEKGPHSPKTSNKTQNYESIYRALGRCSKESSRCPLGPLYILLPRKVRTGGKNRYPRFGALSSHSRRFGTVNGQLASSDESAQTTDCGDKGGLELLVLVCECPP